LGKSKKKDDVLQREQLPAWFAAVRQIGNPVISAYLQALLLTGARREELAALKWEDVDFKWNSLKLNDKVEDFRMVPLTPYVAALLQDLKRLNDTPPSVRALRRLDAKGQEWKPSKWAFSSRTAASGRLTEPSIAHRKACAVAGLDISLHGLRRSFATLSEWTETPAGIAAQIQGHAPQGVREQNYIRRPLDLLRMWHDKIEGWILKEAGITFVPVEPGLRAVQ
jgi:integrase